MATIAESLLRGYSLAHRANPSITKGQYMNRVFPNRYANDKNAAEAYSRTVRGKRTGAGLAKLAPVQHTIYQRGRRVPIGGYVEGLWQVRVYFTAWKDGQPTQQVKSFNVESMEHTTFTSLPYIQELALPLAEEKLVKWCQSFEDCELDHIEVIPVNYIRKPSVDLDEVMIG